MPDEPATRPSLLVRLRDHRDNQAWGEFVELYAALIYTYVRVKNGSRTTAEEIPSNFVLIDDVEFSDEDIHLFKFEGNTGRARSSLDCRLLDFTLRAEQVVDPAWTKNSEK